MQVFFRQGKSLVDMLYQNNQRNFSLLAERYSLYSRHSHYRLKGIHLVSSSSPEGPFRFNQLLSQKRADSVLKFLESNGGMDRSLFHIHSVGEDWKGLRRWLEVMPEIPLREELLDSLEKNSGDEEAELALKSIAGGEPYRYIYQHVYPLLRQTYVTFIVETMPVLKHPGVFRFARTLPKLGMLEIPHSENHPAVVGTVTEKDRSNCYWAFKTNALYDLALVPNIGLEYYIGKNWSVAGNWMYAWWSSDSKHNFWRIYGGDLEARRWFGKKAMEKPLQGHHVGVYAQMYTYDFEFGNEGYQADKWTFGFGLSYGYSIPIARKLNLDFTIGIGYLSGRYKEYIPIEGHYVWQSTNQLNFWGPTKAEVSLVWQLGKGNVNIRKGGNR